MSCLRDPWILSRRQALVASAGLAAGCSNQVARANTLVAVARARAYDQSIYELTRSLLISLKADFKEKHVLLKPNLVEFDADSVINTNPILVHAVVEAVRALGAASVQIGEGPGHRRTTLDMAEEAGYFATIPQFDRMFVDLNLDDVERVSLTRPVSKLQSLYLPKTALRSDVVISMPKMKTHHWVGATLSMKNLFGLVPGAIYGWPKNILHWAGINEAIADLYVAFPRHFAIVDAITGMEGNGPIQGTPKHVGAIVAGQDLLAVDSTCCTIMGLDPQRLNYLQLAGLPHQHITQVAERPDLVRTPFKLVPEMRHLQATERARV